MIKKLNNLHNAKALKILKASLFLNIILASFFVGSFIYTPQPHFKKHNSKYHLVPKDVMRQHRLEIRQAKIELAQALKEEPFNKERVASALEKIDTKIDDIKDSISLAFLNKATHLTPEERLELLPKQLRLKEQYKEQLAPLN